MSEIEPDWIDDNQPYFTGECSCEHHPGQHGWGCCDVDGCSCPAGWEE